MEEIDNAEGQDPGGDGQAHSGQVPDEKEAGISELTGQVARLQGEMEGLRGSLETVSQDAQNWQNEVAQSKAQLGQAVAKYRALVLAQSPEIPEELVAGETIEEMDASVAAARLMVDKVRKQLETKVAADRVPAGAPPRRAPDMSELSPREKIAYALGKH